MTGLHLILLMVGYLEEIITILRGSCKGSRVSGRGICLLEVKEYRGAPPAAATP
jgi:hypothetical protein